MKKQFVILLCLLLTSVSSMAEDVVVDNIKYSLNSSNHTASVISNNYTGDVVIPESVTYNSTSYSVTSIGNYAFRNCSGLTSITIPNSVTFIGYQAFSDCSGLTSITIPNSVTSFGNYSFSGCIGLTSVVSEIETPFTIGTNAFYGISDNCVLTVPKGKIDAYIAAGWTTSVFKGGIKEALSPSDNIPFADANVKALCVANWDTNSDGELSVGEAAAVTSLGTVFENNTTITSFDELQYFTGLTSVEDYAFFNCEYLTSITIPNSVTSIGDMAFYNCSGLTSVTIPNSVTNIGYEAFRYCSGLTSIDIPNSVTSIGDSAFDGCSGMTSVTIPNSVTSIGHFAFEDCSGLTSVTIPNSVTSIGNYAFFGCIGLTSITIPNSVTSIGDFTFFGCSGLTSVTIGNSVTSIGYKAFQYCSGLTSVTIPNSVTGILNYAFDGCSGLTSVVSEIETPFAFGTDAFSGISANCVLTVRLGKTDAYIAAGWTTSVFKGGIKESNIITFADANVKALCLANWDTNSDGILSVSEAAAVTSLGTVFKNNTTITSFDELQYFTGLTSIGDYAFDGCTGLTSITFSNNVTSIGNYAFRNCSGLTSVTIPNSVTSIGSYTFDGCRGLTSITIPNGVTIIYGYTFRNCSGLTSVTIPNSVTSIRQYAFNGCSGLTSVTIGNSVTSIGEGAFSGCSGLTKVIVSDIAAWCRGNYSSNPLYIAHHLYSDSDTEIKDLVIPDGVTSIGYQAFYGCSGLTSVTIPNSVTSIGEGAFRGSGLTSITIPNSVTSIPYAAFSSCSGLTSVIIPNSVTSIGNGAFTNCNYLTSVVSEIETPFTYGSSAFHGISDNCVLTVPIGKIDAYIAAGWTTNVFKGGIVEMAPPTTSASISSAGIATYCSQYALDFSNVDGLKAYIISGFNPSTGTLVLTPVTEVPAGEGLLLKGAQGAYDIPTTTTDMIYTNLLTGVTTATNISPTSGDETNFILANGKYGINFYTLSGSGELAAGKAYLHLPTSALSNLSKERGFTFGFDDEQATDISYMDEDAKDTKVFYDLQGRRVDNPRNGLYIVNGKKVFIK